VQKPKSGKRTSSARRPGAAKNVEEYLSRVAEPARSTLRKMRAAIRLVVPSDATETISYGIPAFKCQKVVVWFAAFSDHCSLFPTARVIEAFKNELQGFSVSKGTIHFPLKKPLPIPLIKKIVKARLAELQTKPSRSK
jgi:uncharacterized protein YdhG (YjbR/CyaY superfamily)